MKLSVIVPAYRQEATIYEDVRNIQAHVERLELPYEIIVVVDGHVDRTYEAALKLQQSAVTVLGYDQNQGKGHAVRTGMRAARGDVIGFIDAGGDLDPADLVGAVRQLIETGADAVVGSKRHPASVVKYPPVRWWYSAVYQVLTWLLFGFNVRDTQAGLKVFRKEVVERVLPLLTVNRYAFDVELLAVTRMLGFARIEEAPIHVRLEFPSSVGGWHTIATMLRDTASVFYRLRIARVYQRRAPERSGIGVNEALRPS